MLAEFFHAAAVNGILRYRQKQVEKKKQVQGVKRAGIIMSTRVGKQTVGEVWQVRSRRMGVVGGVEVVVCGAARHANEWRVCHNEPRCLPVAQLRPPWNTAYCSEIEMKCVV